MAFKCNLQECEERLAQSLGYCDCGHVFCVQHAKDWFRSHKDCPVCGERVRVRWADFATERERALVGCSPEAMLKALEEGMRFWTQQKELERRQKEESQHTGVRYLQDQLRQAEEVIRNLSVHRPAASLATPCLFSPPPNSRFPN